MRNEPIGGKMAAQTTWKTGDIVASTRGKLLCGNTAREFSGIAIDSRSVSRNELFVPVKGETHDGHRFIEAVLDKGIRGLVVEAGNRGICRWKHWPPLMFPVLR